MNELKELESGIERLKSDSRTRKAVIDALEKEKAEMLRRSGELSDKLKQTSESYRKSLGRLTNSVNSQVTQLKMEIAELSNGLKGVSGLEQRLEFQEKRHEEAISKIEKELVVVEKNLSDVERLKTEFSHQRGFFQETKLQMDKSLQAGMAYVRKEMEVNRRDDSRAALEEFKQEIERITSIEKELNAHKTTQGARLDDCIEELSSLKSSLAGLRVLKERSGSLEEFSRGLEKRVSELAGRQKASTAMISSELSKRLDKSVSELKKDIDARHTEDARTHISEFKQELQRVASVEEKLSENEKRLDNLAEELSAFRPVSEHVALLNDRVEENLHMNQSLAGRTVSASDFERATGSISKRTEELENRLFTLDKRLSTDRGMLEKSIIKVLNDEKLLEGTQENIRKWFDAKQQDMEKKISTGLDSLTTQMEDGAALVDHLRTGSQKMDLMTREVPRKLDEQGKHIARLADARGELASSLETLYGDIRGISTGLSSSLERIASLEKGLSSSDKSKETMLDKLSNVVGVMDARLESSRNEIKEFREYVIGHVNGIINAYEKRFGELSKDISGKQMSGMERELAELEHLNAKISELDSLVKELSKKAVTDSEFVETVKALSKRIDSIENLYSDVDKKTSLREVQLDAAIQRALSDDKLLHAGQKHVKEWMESRISETEERLSGDIASQDSRLSGGFAKSRERTEKKLESLSSELKSMNERLIDEKGRRKALEQKLMSSMDAQ